MPLDGPVPPDPQPVWDLLEGFRRSKTMFAAVSLGIFDGARPPGESGRRLLDACAAMGLLAKHEGGYVNTPIADEYLRRDAERSLCGYVAYSNHVLYKVWDTLEDAITGTDDAVRAANGRRTRHLFLKHMRDFVDGMHASGRLSSEVVVAAVELTRFRTLVDVGGGTGHLARAAKQRYPHLDAAVLDLPEVLGEAQERHDALVRQIPGDFMHGELPRADLFALARVLHNLPTGEIERLLSRLHGATAPGGAILVAETLLDAANGASVAAHLQDLNMLVGTAGGRERTAEEYTVLLEAAGYQDVRVVRTGARLDALLALKAGKGSVPA